MKLLAFGLLLIGFGIPQFSQTMAPDAGKIPGLERAWVCKTEMKTVPAFNGPNASASFSIEQEKLCLEGEYYIRFPYGAVSAQDCDIPATIVESCSNTETFWVIDGIYRLSYHNIVYGYWIGISPAQNHWARNRKARQRAKACGWMKKGSVIGGTIGANATLVYVDAKGDGVFHWGGMRAPEDVPAWVRVREKNAAVTAHVP